MLMATFSRREPSPADRVEFAVASLERTTLNMNRKQSSQPLKLSDVLLFRKAWERADTDTDDAAARYSDADKATLAALMGSGR